ncbi:Cytochrome c class I [Sterolibacterium denitrificans]|uniref:Cytochrome c class I n=1 Tax=Sterolibacterium denitrificans TaxID=157592 RepID=A0A7Z7MV71_9PROT|nr:c-type cytochrome [Sterolibacterium denitrificans]SMB26137.1 Cytochrome c class I [Sterolibacterium denitrificans]
MKSTFNTLLGAAVSVIFMVSSAHAFDENAARALAKKNDCFKCHAVDKTKRGPSYKKVAEKYKGRADAEEKIVLHITTGPKVKLEDGSEEDHKIIETKDKAEMKNLIDWILSL